MTDFTNKTEEVEAFLQNLSHPFKKEIEEIRKIIMSANPGIIEQIKWAAPSFAYKDMDYLVTFNLWEKKRVHLVFHNPHIAKVKSELLEGRFEKRRMAYFSDMKDIATKKEELQKVIQELIQLVDKNHGESYRK
jgi:hypothetical protein